MKAIIALAMVMLIGFVLCSNVMVYYPALIDRECPNCKEHVVQEEMISGHTINPVCYTNGRVLAQGLPAQP